MVSGDSAGGAGLQASAATDMMLDPTMWGWQLRAACRGEDSNLYFAPSYFEKRGEKNAREAKAKQICARCEVRERCLEYALKIEEDHGVWGGLNEMERRALRRARALQAG